MGVYVYILTGEKMSLFFLFIYFIKSKIMDSIKIPSLMFALCAQALGNIIE